MKRFFQVALLAALLLTTTAVGQEYLVPFAPRAATACLGDGANFPGDNTNYAYVEVFNDPAGLEFSETGDWSVIAFARREVNTDEHNITSQHGGGGTNRQMTFHIDNGANADIQVNQTGTNVVTGSGAIAVNTWYVVAVAHDTDDADVDMDSWIYAATDCSTAAATDTGTSKTDSTGTPTDDVVIGAKDVEGTLSDNFDGDLAYVVYLDGTTIVTADVEAFCNDACAQIATWGTAAKFALELDGDFTDSSGNTNDGTKQTGGTGDITFNTSGGPYD